MNLRLHQLRALTGVVEHGSIRAAARHLYVSQAALTKALRELEDDAGVALLVRSARGVQLTPEGQRLLARARLVVRQLDLAEQELAQAQHNAHGPIHIALTPFLTLTHLGPLVQAFRQRYPQVPLELMEGLASRALPRLRDGSLDWAAVVDVGDLPLSEFHSQVLGRIEQHIVVRQGHPLAQTPDVAGLTALEWVQSGPSDGRRGQRVQQMFIQKGLPPPQRVLHCDALAALSLLRTTDMIGVVPAPLLAQPEGRDLVALHVPALHLPSFTLVLLSQPDVPLAAPAAYLADCLGSALLHQ